MKRPHIEEKVDFLSRPEAYPNNGRHVETIQTHMSWVFLTDTHAWKLKKPVHTDHLDFSTLEARRRNCVREVRLNRRLAPDVYLGVVPLTIGSATNFQLAGEGTIVDWLVSMRRLPSDRMLDALIARRAVLEEDLSRLASTLVAFYRKARPVTGDAYRKRLTADLNNALIELSDPNLGLDTDLADSLIRSLLKFLRANSKVFDSRVHSGRIVEAHGDLRPEHICLEPQPVIIDCLEFNRSLRVLDVVSELMFLALECDRIGAGDIGEFILTRCCKETDDQPSSELLAFYKAYHACVRARIAVWHLQDEGIRDQDKWIAKAHQYLHMVAGFREAA